MSLNIQSRIPHYKSLAPVIKSSTSQRNQLPSIGSVFPEFFRQRAQSIPPPRSAILQPSVAPATTPAPVSHGNVNYSMPFLYSMHGRLRSRIQSKSYLPRRKRVTTHQLQVLNEEFKKNPFPSIEQRSQLSERLNISARSIQIWFQNKRQTVRSFNY